MQKAAANLLNALSILTASVFSLLLAGNLIKIVLFPNKVFGNMDPYDGGFSEGYFFGIIFLLVTFASIVYANIRIILSCSRYLKDGNSEDLRKALKLSLIPVLSPGIVLGIPIGAYLLFTLKSWDKQ